MSLSRSVQWSLYFTWGNKLNVVRILCTFCPIWITFGLVLCSAVLCSIVVLRSTMLCSIVPCGLCELYKNPCSVRSGYWGRKWNARRICCSQMLSRVRCTHPVLGACTKFCLHLEFSEILPSDSRTLLRGTSELLSVTSTFVNRFGRNSVQYTCTRCHWPVSSSVNIGAA